MARAPRPRRFRMQLDHKTGELRDLQELNLYLLIAFSALYSLRLFEVVDLVQDSEFPPALLHALEAGLLALALVCTNSSSLRRRSHRVLNCIEKVVVGSLRLRP